MGAYFYCKLVNTKTKQAEYFFKWHDTVSELYDVKSFTVTCGGSDAGYELIFGTNGFGRYSVDDIIVSGRQNGGITAATEQEKFITPRPEDAQR